MATKNKNLSKVGDLPKVNPAWRFAIVKAEWNEEITNGLLDGAMDLLINADVPGENIHTLQVPGSFELPLGAQWAIESHGVDAVICLGAVIRGETSHFDYVCQAVSSGIKQLNLDYNLPIIFGVLTDDNIEQSRARSGGKHGNKGTEAAASAIKMLALRDSLDS
ncbi:MAG: 6,7-dimethyl-8-ribityllumazine synthase [Flavobacteriales bacterium]